MASRQSRKRINLEDETIDLTDDVPELAGPTRLASGAGGLKECSITVKRLKLEVEDDDAEVATTSRRSRADNGNPPKVAKVSRSKPKQESKSEAVLDTKTVDAANTKVRSRCKFCQQYEHDPDFRIFSGDPENAVSEFDMLIDERLQLESSNTEELQTRQITNFSVYDELNHLCPFDGSIIERNVALYFSGDARGITASEDDGDVSIPTAKIGPILEWWLSGFDGGHKAILGFSTEYCEYVLLSPSEQYKHLAWEPLKKIYLAKFVIEFIQNNEDADFDDLLNSIQLATTPEGITIMQDDLLTYAQFILVQVENYDNSQDAGEDDQALSSSRCIQDLVEIAGCKKQKKSSQQRVKVATKKTGPTTPKARQQTLATTTTLVHQIFGFQFPEEVALQKSGKMGKVTGRLCGKCPGCTRAPCGRCTACKAARKTKSDQRGKQESTCVKKRCTANENVPYVYLSDEDELSDEKVADEVSTSKTKRYKNLQTKVSWKGRSVTSTNRTYYKCVQINGEEVKTGDFVLLDLVVEQTRMGKVAKVAYMFEEKGDMMFHAVLFKGGEETLLRDTADAQELFFDDSCEDVSLGNIRRKVKVTYEPVPSNWSELGGIDNCGDDHTHHKNDPLSYYFSMMYDTKRGRFEDLPSLFFKGANELGSSFCCVCQRSEDRRKRTALVLGNNVPSKGDNLYQSFVWKGDNYEIGSCVLIKPDSFSLVTHHSLLPEGKPPKVKVDETKYPEYYRKTDSDYMRGNNGDIPDTYRLGRISEILCNNPKSGKPESVHLTVCIFYRPENTTCSQDECFQADYNYVYWSNDEKRVQLTQTSGLAYVIYGPNAKTSMDEFREAGPRRFYYNKGYNGRVKEIFTISPSVKKQTEGMAQKFPDYPKLKEKLKAFDIFSGCGGMSEGFHESGICETKWAIEINSAAAKAFQKNNRDCVVFTQDCNALLKAAMEGKQKNDVGQPLPRKGDVDLICGGPPCQGFSGMNRFNSGKNSKFQNSLVATFLSYCDFYRPKYFILENVRNFVSFKRSMVLKLTMCALVRMGYQCTFGILQAGSYGVPQTRRRAIIIAAAPGEILPEYPLPQHVFSKRACQLTVNIDDIKYEPVGGADECFSALYRQVTVRDAMGDLPAIKNGATNGQLEYKAEPRSQFQRMVRDGNRQTVILDHVCKEMNPLVKMRMHLIPKEPGADWRDLPNIAVALENGQMTRVLEYEHDDVKQGRSKSGRYRGVCPCAAGQECDPGDRQMNTVIPWCLPHTSNRHNNWAGLYGRLNWTGYFCTTVTNPEPMGKQGCVVHPDQDRVVSVRECARSQGFPDSYQFAGTTLERHTQVGNAVPPPLAKAIGMAIGIAMSKKEDK